LLEHIQLKIKFELCLKLKRIMLGFFEKLQDFHLKSHCSTTQLQRLGKGARETERWKQLQCTRPAALCPQSHGSQIRSCFGDFKVAVSCFVFISLFCYPLTLWVSHGRSKQMHNFCLSGFIRIKPFYCLFFPHFCLPPASSTIQNL
jgi:hypothetical protein